MTKDQLPSNKTLRRFWFQFEFSHYSELPGGVAMGCGITAISEEAAIELLKRRVFKGAPLPKFTVQADIDISTLDPGRVRPNMHVPVWPGVWFPMGFEGD